MMNISDTNALPDQYPFRQEDRYLLDGQGNIPLHRAVKGRDKKTVVQSLNARVDLGHTNFMDRTPLMLAIEYDDKDIVGTLIEYKADINQKMDVDSSQEIALKGDRPLSTDRWGQENTPFSVTPLALAAQKGLATIVKLLLDHKADCDQVDEKGISPIVMAILGGHASVIKVFIDANANINTCGSSEAPLICIAANQGHEQVVALLIAHHAEVNRTTIRQKISPLIEASSNGYISLVNFLINQHADVNQCTQDGTSSLLFASQGGYLDVVNLLLENKADATKKNRANLSPLLAVAQQGNPIILSRLIQYKAIVDIYKQKNEISKAFFWASQEVTKKS